MLIQDTQILTTQEDIEINDLKNDIVSDDEEIDESPVEKESEEWFKTIGLFS